MGEDCQLGQAAEGAKKEGGGEQVGAGLRRRVGSEEEQGGENEGFKEVIRPDSLGQEDKTASGQSECREQAQGGEAERTGGEIKSQQRREEKDEKQVVVQCEGSQGGRRSEDPDGTGVNRHGRVGGQQGANEVTGGGEIKRQEDE